MINPKRKSSYTVCKQDTRRKFTSIEVVQTEIKEIEIGNVGYVAPGHGLKGKHETLAEDEDLVSMYTECKSRKGDIMLWYYAIVPENHVQESEKSAPKKRHRL